MKGFLWSQVFSSYLVAANLTKGVIDGRPKNLVEMSTGTIGGIAT
jgi:hypothetical protein